MLGENFLEGRLSETSYKVSRVSSNSVICV